jgi:hypothetical protein
MFACKTGSGNANYHPATKDRKERWNYNTCSPILTNLSFLSLVAAKRRLIVRPLQKAIVAIFCSSANLTHLAPEYAKAPVHTLLGGSSVRWSRLRLDGM